ncbi:VWA domain-containing protein [bacterium]|nr:VWA domain-containing protein [candidate division CSSED10-310 bacterium]
MKKRNFRHMLISRVGVLIILLYSVSLSGQDTPVENHAPVDVMLVLDNSGSMKTHDPEFLMSTFVSRFCETIPSSVHVGIIIFDANTEMVLPLTPSGISGFKDRIAECVAKINYRGKWTNSPDALEKAVYQLKNQGREDSAKMILFFTDGIVDTGNPEEDERKSRWLEEDITADARQNAIRIFGIAFTENADYTLIQRLAQRTGGEYYRAFTLDELSDVFKKIGTELLTTKPQRITANLEKTGVFKEQEQSRQINIPLWIIIAGAAIIAGFIWAVFAVLIRRQQHQQLLRELAKSPVTGSSGAGKDVLEDPDVPPAKLVDIGQIMPVLSYDIKRRITRIGRVPEINDIVISKDTVSKQHAVVEYKNGIFTLMDLRSANGTSLNGKKFSSTAENKEMPLKSGDKIKFDIFEFQFFIKRIRDVQPTKLRPIVKEEKQEKQGSVEKSEPHMRQLETPLKPEQTTEDFPLSSAPEHSDFPEEKTLKEDMARLSARCRNHPKRKAPRLCPICNNTYCLDCMTEKDGRIMCKSCADSPDKLEIIDLIE